MRQKMNIEISVTNFITVGLMATVFVYLVKMATKKAGVNIGI
jgi:hypothetical protein